MLSMQKYQSELVKIAKRNANASKERSKNAFEEDQKIISYFSVQRETKSFLINGKVAHPAIVGGIAIIKGTYHNVQQVDCMGHILHEVNC